MVGRSPQMQAIREIVSKVAASPSTVLITAESGTGKELVARALHLGSPRRNQPFIKVNCAAIPAGLVESELFGHERGAFTGAVSSRPGRFELADGGTLFLDEVSEIPQARSRSSCCAPSRSRNSSASAASRPCAYTCA
jgi:two-component system response regulator AtoC